MIGKGFLFRDPFCVTGVLYPCTMAAIFYAPDMYVNPVLSEEESRHCVKVLRHTMGDIIKVVDGKGTLAEAEIILPDPKSCRFRILKLHSDFDKRPVNLTLAIAPPKNASRFEWMLEKITEIGVDTIQPVWTGYGERDRLKTGRLLKIMISAMKQSQKATVPLLHEMVNLEDYIKSMSKSNSQLFIAYLSMTSAPLQKVCEPGKPVVVLVGPEGDFTDEEVKFAESMGFRAISLGPYRLRTETAGLVACHTVQLLNQG